MATVRIDMHQAAIFDLLHSPAGPVHRKVASVLRVAEALAKATAPVDEGRLKNSHTSSIADEGVRLRGRLEATAWYAALVARGTGIYGPKGTPIRPKKPGGFLVFRGRDGSLVFAREVKGQRPNLWLVNALKLASPWPVDVHPL